MSITKYRAFIKVVELSNITKAAKALQYSQPAISRMIDSLEDEIGFPLLNRGKDALTPTENGKIVLKHCYQIVQAEDELQMAVDAIKDILTGDIRVGAFNCMLMYLLPQVLSEFSAEHPLIHIHLQETSFHSSCELLKSGQIDLAFMNQDIPSGFEFRPLFQDPLGIVINLRHPLASCETVSIHQLANYDFIMPQPGWDAMFQSVIRQVSFIPRAKHHVASDNAGIAIASNSMGIFILSQMQAISLPSNVVFRPFMENLSRTLGVCVKSFRETPPALKEFIKSVMKYRNTTLEMIQNKNL